MPTEGGASSADRLLDAVPALRHLMKDSPHFAAMKERQRLVIDGESLFIVRQDVLGDEEELYADTLARGASERSDDALARAMYLELEQEMRAAVTRFLRTDASG